MRAKFAGCSEPKCLRWHSQPVFSPRMPRTVRVFAAASLTEALEAVVSEAKPPVGPGISLNLAGSNTLIRQILEGARADLVVTADEASMQRLVDAGLLDAEAIKVLLSNTLVVAAGNDFAPLLSCSNLADPRFRRLEIAASATAPAGIYARRALDQTSVLS